MGWVFVGGRAAESGPGGMGENSVNQSLIVGSSGGDSRM